MFFSKKKTLRQKYDEKLVLEINALREKWKRQKNLAEITFSPTKEFEVETKLFEIKYFYLFHEAKIRNLNAKATYK